MKAQLLLIVVCDDRPGIVEKIAETVHANNGNWLESRLSRLSGKFAGIVQIETDAEHEQSLTEQLLELRKIDILISVEKIKDTAFSEDRSEKQTESHNKNKENSTSYSFSIAGNDRAGIIREVSQAFSVRRINLENLSSQCTSMPHSGTPLFEASGKISVPASTDIDELSTHLDRISDELAIDIQLEEI
ncbi:MAG: cellulose-binding protein [Cellvibrionaceae bacterium]